jgi:hypothetical protein
MGYLKMFFALSIYGSNASIVFLIKKKMYRFSPKKIDFSRKKNRWSAVYRP